MTPMPRQGGGSGVFTTPAPFIAATKALLQIERFVVDLAADDSNAQASHYITAEEDSLTRDWTAYAEAGWCWLNPPFYNIAAWTQKAAAASRVGTKIAMLLPASVGADWFADFIYGRASVYFLRGRLAFMPDRPEYLYPKDCMLVLFGALPRINMWDWRLKTIDTGLTFVPSLGNGRR